MSGVWGNNIKFSIFGESHGRAIGITIDGFKAGIKIEDDYVKKQMERRMPGVSELSTTRKEGDNYEILSGVFNGKTTGAPICCVIYNENTISKDYEQMKTVMRPGHADYTGYKKYNGFNDYRGGGHFSGRLTAPIVFAGAICSQILERQGIVIGSHIRRIGEIASVGFRTEDICPETLKNFSESKFPVLENENKEKIIESILNAKEDGDSLGGIVETVILNVPVGVGNPFFNSIESTLSQLLFSIPAVKGIEFGAGFEISKMKGSEANDEFFIDKQNRIRTKSNNNGGVLGGISNGMPIVFRAAIKPTPSISKIQNSVDVEKNQNATIEIKGRHDPCIVPRAIPVIDAITAMGILDLMTYTNN